MRIMMIMMMRPRMTDTCWCTMSKQICTFFFLKKKDRDTRKGHDHQAPPDVCDIQPGVFFVSLKKFAGMVVGRKVGRGIDDTELEPGAPEADPLAEGVDCRWQNAARRSAQIIRRRLVVIVIIEKSFIRLVPIQDNRGNGADKRGIARGRGLIGRLRFFSSSRHTLSITNSRLLDRSILGLAGSLLLLCHG